jgi:hypothetical protein
MAFVRGFLLLFGGAVLSMVVLFVGGYWLLAGAGQMLHREMEPQSWAEHQCGLTTSGYYSDPAYVSCMDQMSEVSWWTPGVSNVRRGYFTVSASIGLAALIMYMTARHDQRQDADIY